MGNGRDPSPDSIDARLQRAREALAGTDADTVDAQLQEASDALPSTDAVDTQLQQAATALRRGDDMQQRGEAQPQTEDLETVFSSATDAGTSASRTQAFGELFKEEAELPGRIQEALQEAGPDDPGIEPGDQSAEEQDLRTQIAETLATTALATVPGTPQNREVAQAIANGFEVQLKRLQRNAAQMQLLSPGSVQGGPMQVVPNQGGVEETTEADRREAAKQWIELTRELESISRPEGAKRAAREESIFGAIGEVAKDPAASVPFLVSSSALSSAPATAGTILGSAGGPVTAAVGAYLGTLPVVQQESIASLLAESGADVSSPKDLLAVASDPKKRREILRRSAQGGASQAAVEGLFGAATAGLARVGMSPVARAAGGLATETAGEGAGEATRQVVAGEEFNEADIGLEMVAALGQSGATSVGTVALSELTPSEERVRSELERVIDETDAELEVPESQLAQLMQRAIDRGGLEQPHAAAERELNRALRQGEIQIETPEADEQPPEETASEETALGDQPEADPADSSVPGEQEAEREPATPEQRLQALGIDPSLVAPSREEVATLEEQARQMEEMETADLEQRGQALSDRLDELRDAQQDPQREAPTGALDPNMLEALRQLVEEELRGREAEEAGGQEPDAEPEVPEPGEPLDAFARNVTRADIDMLQTVAGRENMTSQEAALLRSEVQKRREADEIDENEAEAILGQLPAESEEAAGEEAPEDGEAAPDQDEEADEDAGPEAEETDTETDEERRARRREELGLPDAAPLPDDIEEGDTFVDTGGTQNRTVTIAGDPNDRTVSVEKEDPHHGTFRTTALLKNLRRPGEVESDPPGSSLPMAGIDDGGRAELTNEYQIVPEGATIPDEATVRHDIGTSDLPAARLPEDPDVATQDLGEMGRRAPTREEQQIQQQISSVQEELDQARQRLKDLRAQMPETDNEEIGRLFGQGDAPVGGQQASLGNQFERSTESTEQLQQLIDEQEQVVERLQERLMDLRQRQPDAEEEARTSQTDISDQAASTPDAEGEFPPRSAADMTTPGRTEMSDPGARDRRTQAIFNDLMDVLRGQFRGQPGLEAIVEDVARITDRIRELRAARDRGLINDTMVEEDVARMQDLADEKLAEAEQSLAPAEMDALRGRVEAWQTSVAVPSSPSVAHLNALSPGRRLGPDYVTAGNYEVRQTEAGTYEIVSPNTGEPIDRRSSAYDDALVEWLVENAQAIDQTPRITDTNPDIAFGQWPRAVAGSSRNPLEIIEALLIEEGKDNVDPVALRLQEAKIETDSLTPYIARSELIERGAGNWVDPDGRPIENIARDISRDLGISLSPQQIIDDYVLAFPGGPSTVETATQTGALQERFEDVTGLRLTPEVARRVHEAAYEDVSNQQGGDRGTAHQREGGDQTGPGAPSELQQDAPFEPRRPYLHRPTMRRSGTYAEEDAGLEAVAEGYKVREGEAGGRQIATRVLEQLSLFGPENTDDTPHTPAEAQSADPSDQSMPPVLPAVDNEERLQRIEENLLGRAITDDLAQDGRASLIGRIVRGPDDIAALAQVYRDPRFETFRIFFVRDREDGGEEIVHQTGLSQRLPGQVDVFPLELEGTAYVPDDVNPSALSQWDRVGYWMSHQMDELGADGYYLQHNHPTGEVEPSQGDINSTKKYAFEASGLRGHVIIDSGQYTILSTEGAQDAKERYMESAESLSGGASKGAFVQKVGIQRSTKRIDDPEVLRRGNIENTDDRLLEPSLRHPVLGELVTVTGDMAQIGKELQGIDSPIVIMTGSNGRVRGLMEIDADFLRTASPKAMGRELLALARHTGSIRAFFANVPQGAVSAVQRHFETGAITDFVTEGGTTSIDLGLQPSTGARTNTFGLGEGEISKERVMEEGPSYGRDLRDEVRRRLGRPAYETEGQRAPEAGSGPTEGESIRQAAVRIEGQLYRGQTHPEALQAAINDGAAQRSPEGLQLADGTPMEAAVEEGRAQLTLYTTTAGRVVEHQRSSTEMGVPRGDMVRRPQPRTVGPIAPGPDPQAVHEALQAIQDQDRRVEASGDLPAEANSVDGTLAGVPEAREQQDEIRRSLQNEALGDDENPISEPQVIDSFVAVARAAGRDMPVRYGRYRGFSFSASGVFKVEPEVMRLKEANDIPVAAHELGHVLEKAIFGWEEGSAWQKAVAGTGGDIQDELVQLGRDLYGDQQPAGGYKREGFAEFMKWYMLGQERLTERAPKMVEWFETTFAEEHPGVFEAIEAARSRARTWFEQGALNRARASVVQDRTFWTDFKEAVTREEGRERLQTQLSQATLTEFSPLLRVVEAAEERLGRDLPVEENPFLTAEALAKTHGARTRTFVEQGTFDFAGNPVGPPLRDAAHIVEGQRNEFTLYLWARRALKLWEGREATYDEDGTLIEAEKEPRNPGLSQDDAEYIFEVYDSPAFRQAAEQVYQWNNEVLDYTKAAFDPDLAERIKGGDVGDYIPLQRVFDELNQAVTQIRRSQGTVKGSNPVEALQGSSRRIRDPFEAMIEQASELIRATHQKYIINQLVDLAQNVEGLGRYIERVPRDQVPESFRVERVVSELRAEGLEVDVPQEELNQRVEQLADARDRGENDLSASEMKREAREQLMEEKMQGVVTFFKPAIVPEGTRDPIIPIQDEGDVKWFRMSRELYDTFEGLDVYRLPWLLDWLFGVPARTMRLGTTGVRASFAFVTNPIRDIAVLHAQSRSSADPAKLTAYWAQSMSSGMKAALRGDLSEDPHFQRWARLGGRMSRPLGPDRQETQRAISDVFANRKTRILDPQNWVDQLRDIFEIPESAPRVAEFKGIADEMGWEPGTKMSDHQALRLLLDSKRVTTDFTSQGQITKVINQMIPFTTAQIGGQRAMVRAFQQNPTRAIAAGMTIAAATAGYWWKRKDEDWYNDLLPRHKYNNWYFPDVAGFNFVLPKPFEWGSLFSSVPEALLDAWYKNDARHVEDVIGHLYKNLWPLGTTQIWGTSFPFQLPQALHPLAEQLAGEGGRQFYFNRPIVPRGEWRKPPAEQFGPYTSTLAKVVGDTFSVSPRRLEHLIAGYLGGVGRDAVQAMDGLFSALGIEGPTPKVEREFAAPDLPVVGKLFRPGGRAGISSETVNTFYKRLQDFQTRQASDVIEETRTQKQARLLMQDAQQALSVLNWLQSRTRSNERREELQVHMREIAEDVMTTTDQGLEAILRKRGQIRTLQSLSEYTDRFGPDRAEPLINRGLQAVGRPAADSANPIDTANKQR